MDHQVVLGLESVGGVQRCHDAVEWCEFRDPRGEVHDRAEEVTFSGQNLTERETDAQRRQEWIEPHRFDQVDGYRTGDVSGIGPEHDLVADELHDAAAVSGDRVGRRALEDVECSVEVGE